VIGGRPNSTSACSIAAWMTGIASVVVWVVDADSAKLVLAQQSEQPPSRQRPPVVVS
jgi:hypothetical protein